MATFDSRVPPDGRRNVSVLRLLITGAVSATVIFILCWIGTTLPISSPTHAYISLFTNSDAGSPAALVEGSVWSFLFGGLAAAVLALTYNAVSAFGTRQKS